MPKSPKMDAPSLENPNAPLRLLSLDGGGVRGLSSLMVLEDLMESIALEEKRLKKRPVSDNTPLKPCDYFDLIGGTSTGGIIAVLLGRLQLDCRQCIQIYTKVSQKIFRKDRSVTVGGVHVPYTTTRFSGSVLEKSVKEALVELGFDPNEKMWDGTLFEERVPTDGSNDNIWASLTGKPLSTSPEDSQLTGSSDPLSSVDTASSKFSRVKSWAPGRSDSFLSALSKRSSMNAPHRRLTWRYRNKKSVHKRPNQKGCRTFVVATLKNALGLPRILSTYDPNDRETRIWEALRATSAAPTFFEEMTFGTPRVTYLDGAMGFNNPTAEVDYAAKSIWSGRAIGIIVSIGTGLQTIPSVKPVASWLPFGLGTDIALASALASMATGTARVDNEMQRMYHGSSTQYYRFDVDGGLQSVSLEAWMKEDEMAALTEQYMRDPEQLARAKTLGEQMVKLSALPPAFEVDASRFRVGMSGRGIIEGGFAREEIDLKTGRLLHTRWEGGRNSPDEHGGSPDARMGGIVMNNRGSIHKVLPIAADLDGDGKREEAIITTCVNAEDVFLRAMRTGIPQGRYRVKFIVSFYGASESAAAATPVKPPVDLVFSAGKPFDAATFPTRFIDVHITSDPVPVLLHPDAVRVRVGKERFADLSGKGWTEIHGDVEVNVGLDGALGFVISKKFREGEFIGGWSFGGVRMDPVMVDEPKT
jgi:predicted acylesterase/phospholipase RssA